MDDPRDLDRPLPAYTQALAMALERRRQELLERHRRWHTEAVAALDGLQRVASDCLEGDSATAAELQIEMQRDLLDHMPDPANWPDGSAIPDLNPREPGRARDDIVATARFIEWLLFRKFDVPPEDIARLFDWTELSRQTTAYGRLLQTVENDANTLLSKTSPQTNGVNPASEPTPATASHLRLVE